eukprot:GHVN01086813.1.p1 GENE.GHVN01086813.1~~GHVN01086813.1.p1  ORF type:complete len:306 (+),score=32.45 GHVN01086813.1:128-919(+)
MGFKSIFALAALGLLGSAASQNVITCKCAGPGCGTEKPAVEEPAACECADVEGQACKITVMDQGSPQRDTSLTCEGAGCRCTTQNIHNTICGVRASVEPVTCTTGFRSPYWTMRGDHDLFCGLFINKGGGLSWLQYYGVGPTVLSNGVFGCRPADGVVLKDSCIWESYLDPPEGREIEKVYCTLDHPQCMITSVSHPQISCVGIGCIATRAPDGVVTVSSPEKGAVVSFSDSLFCTNPPEGEGDCVCSNEGEGMVSECHLIII